MAPTWASLVASTCFLQTITHTHTANTISVLNFAVSYSFFGARTPFLQRAAISAAMAAIGPLDSLANVDMAAIAWVRFVPVPLYMTKALSTERCSRPRATVANQDFTVAPLEQTVAHAGEISPSMFDICKRANACVPSLLYVDSSSCLW